MPRTSVILPVFNAASTVGRAVASVLAQTDADLEIILVDDGSTDESLGIVRAIDDDRLRVIAHASNRGISAARNTGLGAATGEFVAFLDADDAWEPLFLARLHGARGDADAAICGRTIVLPDGTERSAHSARTGSMSGEEAAIGMMTGSVTPFPWDKIIRRAAFAGVSYPVDVHRFEDQVVGILVLSRVASVVSIPDALVRYHIAAGSLTWGRVPEVAEAERALAFLASGLGEWLSAPPREAAFAVCRTLFLMLTAQSAMRSDDVVASMSVLSECRRRITVRMVAVTLRTAPVFGLGSLLLKINPSLYRAIFRFYVRRQYALS